MTIAGQMQPTPLLIGSILDYAASAHGSREIVSREIDGERIWRYDYARLALRAAQVAHMLDSLVSEAATAFRALPGILTATSSFSTACPRSVRYFTQQTLASPTSNSSTP